MIGLTRAVPLPTFLESEALLIPAFISIIVGVPLKATVYGSRSERKNYRLAPRCHRDRKRQVEPVPVHRDKPLRAGITVRRGKQRRAASGGRVAPAAATTRPSSRSPADSWSCHLPTSRRRYTVAWRKLPRISAVAPPAFRKLAPTIPSRRTRSLQVYFNVTAIRVYHPRDSYSVFANRARASHPKRGGNGRCEATRLCLGVILS